MQEELKKPEYKDMKLVKIAYGNDEDQKSFTETQGLLQAYPNLKGIISPTSVGIAAAARYISTSPYKGKVVLTGLGTPNQLREFVKDGTIKEFELWNPADVGYLAAYAAAQLASGNIQGKEGETFAAGKLARSAKIEWCCWGRRQCSLQTTSTNSISKNLRRELLDAFPGV
jgi:rhamnose transport system substrate-binding protein